MDVNSRILGINPNMPTLSKLTFDKKPTRTLTRTGNLQDL